MTLKILALLLFSAACLTGGVLIERSIIAPATAQNEPKTTPRARDFIKEELQQKIEIELKSKGYSLENLKFTKVLTHSALAKEIVTQNLFNTALQAPTKDAELDVFGANTEDLSLIFQISVFDKNNKVDEVGFTFELRDLL